MPLPPSTKRSSPWSTCSWVKRVMAWPGLLLNSKRPPLTAVTKMLSCAGELSESLTLMLGTAEPPSLMTKLLAVITGASLTGV